MKIVPGGKEQYAAIMRIWEDAVRATHHFLAERHILKYRKAIRNHYLDGVTLFLAVKDERIAAFMGLAPVADGSGPPGPFARPGARVEMLFVAPEAHGQGLGRALLEYAAARYGSLDVDVNEQNPGALVFYERCGFVRTGRSERDGAGDPFPLVHMRREEAPLAPD